MKKEQYLKKEVERIENHKNRIKDMLSTILLKEDERI